ncbi:helix-turn-helix domain-containing protein [Cryobacterium psychrophilum]|nr:helix-turn-helix transcriptional regulator [Cryobacterium psychrophilum]TDW31008.1 helix-turn-helix protein [Cryobacterium psychrophilum]
MSYDDDLDRAMEAHYSGGDEDTVTAAEFKILRERLGVSGRWLADRVGVQDRQVRRWESGVAPVPADVVALIEGMDVAADKRADDIAREWRTGGPARMVSYRNDDEYWASDADAMERGEPASYYRAILGRVMAQGVTPIEYLPAEYDLDKT